VNKPYTEKSNGGYIIRKISANIDEMELIWHQDKRNRIVEIISGNNWQFQFDNELPVEINAGDVLHIPGGKIHRVIRGTTDLKIKIQEYDR